MLLFPFLGLLALPSLTAAVKTVTACVQTCGGLTTICATEYDTITVANVSTVTSTNTVPSTMTISATETTHVFVTVTPSPGSTTTTVTTTLLTTTTLANVSSVLTVTETSTNSITSTITKSATMTETVTSSTAVVTTTATTQLAFRYASDTWNTSPSNQKRKEESEQEREQGSVSYGNSSSSILDLTGFESQLQVKRIACEVKSVITETRIVFSTATLNSTVTPTQLKTLVETDSTTTTLSVGDVTVTKTQTVTSTSTQGPSTISSTTTKTVTTATNIYTTITDTVTSTSTIYLTFTSTFTANGACETNNFFGANYQNKGESRVVMALALGGAPKVWTNIMVKTIDVAACCNDCFGESSSCAAWEYLPTAGICTLWSKVDPDSICAQAVNPAPFVYLTDAKYETKYKGTSRIVGNGQCGYIYEQGPLDAL